MITSDIPQLQEPYYYHRLSNGLEVIGQKMPSLGSVVFGLQIDAGSANESDSQLGLCQLLEDMLFQGTTTRSTRQITDAFELLGARRISGSGYETVRYGAQVVHTRLNETLSLLADIILHPTFPAKEFDQLKQLLLQAIKRRDDEPMRRGSELLSQTFFAGSHMGRSILGTVETVQSLSVEQIRAFYQDHYYADKAMFTIAGNFEWNEVIAQVESLFGQWATGGIAPYRDIPHPQTSSAFEVSKGEQEHVYFAYPAITWGDPDFYAHLLGIEAFGGGSMTSRLFNEVREKRGLVYSVAAQVNPSRALGGVLIYGGAPPEKAREMIEVILKELFLYQQEGITQDELDRAKIQLKSEMVMGSESANSRMNSIARSWWYERRVITTQEVKNAIDAITVEQIRQLNHRIPAHTLTIAGIGPLTGESLLQGIFPPVQ